VVSTADTRGLKDTARDATLAAAAAKELDRQLRSEIKTADVASAAAREVAKADKLAAEANALLAGSADEASTQLRKQGRQAEETAAKTRLAGDAAKGAGGGFAALQSPMAAAIGAGVALAPIAVTLAAGLGGLGLAALSASKDTKAMSGILGPLKGELAAFDASLKPEVLQIFGTGAGIAQRALHDLQPVAAATGKALDGVLGQVGAEFRSGQWQQFFAFMARTAGPDMQLLGANITDLIRILPQLLTNLQPIATELLQTTDAAVKLIGAADRLGTAAGNLGSSSKQSSSGMDLLTNAVKRAVVSIIPGAGAADLFRLGVSKIAGSSPGAASGITAVAAASADAAPKVATLAQQVTHLGDAYSAALSPLLAYSNAQIAQADDAVKLQKALKASHDQIGLGTAAQRASFSAADTYIQDLLTTSSAAQKSGRGLDAQISSIRSALPALEHVRGGTRAYWEEVQNLVGWLNRLNAEKAITERVTVFGNGQWTRNATTGPGSTGGGHQLALGGLVSGGTAGRDSVAALLTPGEVVVPAPMVRAGAVDHLRGALPGFAAGGIVPSYSGAVKGLPGWGDANRAATVSAITGDIASAWAKQFAAIAATGFLGAGFGSYAADIQAVLGAMGLPLSLTANWLRQIQTESGGNLRAVNLTDSNAQAGHPSVGLLQIIPSTFAAYSGPYRNTPPLVNFGGGTVSEDAMAQIYTGVHYAAARYGGAAMAGVIGQGHGYDQGGWLKPGLTLAYNGTGRPEQVIPPGGRGGGTVHVHLENHGVIGSEAQLRNWVGGAVDDLARNGKLYYAINQSPSRAR
jgi:SLT domain-containing protein